MANPITHNPERVALNGDVLARFVHAQEPDILSLRVEDLPKQCANGLPERRALVESPDWRSLTVGDKMGPEWDVPSNARGVSRCVQDTPPPAGTRPSDNGPDR